MRWKWIKSFPWRLLAVLVAVGGALGLASFQLVDSDPDRQWVSDALLSLGSAFLLVMPIAVITFRIEQHVNQVREEVATDVKALDRHITDVRDEVASNVESLNQRVGEVEQKAARGITVADVAERVTSRLTEYRKADLLAFELLQEVADWPTVSDALRRAEEVGVIHSATRVPRVPIGEDGLLYMGLRLRPPALAGRHERVLVSIETPAGDVIQSLAWNEDDAIEDLLVAVGRIFEGETGKELTSSDVIACFREFSELLKVGNSHPARRPIVQLCPPQWAVTTRGVVTYDTRRVYSYSIEQLRTNHDAVQHIAGKQWSDVESFDEARTVALDLLAEQPPF